MPFDIFLKVSEAFKIYFKPVFLSVLAVGFLLLYLLLSLLAFCFPILSFLAWLLLHIIFPLLQRLWGFWGAGAQCCLSGAEGQRGWREGILEANKWCHLCSESMAPGAGRTQHKFLPGERQAKWWSLGGEVWAWAVRWSFLWETVGGVEVLGSGWSLQSTRPWTRCCAT